MTIFKRVLLLVFSLFSISIYGIEIDQSLLETPKLQSQIDWHKLDKDRWYDLDDWFFNTISKKTSKSKAQKKEFLGQVIDCLGKCKLYRDLGRHHVQFRSKIYEGDELKTDDKSRMWVILIDGTLLRLFPNSSISLKEVNISNKKYFYQFRVNYGLVSIVNRSKVNNNAPGQFETDQLFLPLSFKMANPEIPKFEYSKDSYQTMSLAESQRKKLKKIFSEDLKINRSTEYLVVLPNSNISSLNSSLNIFVKVGGDSLIQYVKNEKEGFGKIFFRGYENKLEKNLANNKWVKVEKNGENSFEVNPNSLRQVDLILKRIPTILIAREIILKTYQTEKMLSEYQLWSDKSEIYNLTKRIEFLMDFTRRIETTQLKTTEIYLKTLSDSLRSEFGRSYTESFIEKELDAYYTSSRSKELTNLKFKNKIDQTLELLKYVR